MPKLVGICGAIGCGKSTVVEYISKKYGFVEYSFATPLKEIAKIVGFEHNQVYGTQEQKLEINKFWNVSGREFLQKFGSEVCRDALPTVIPNMNFANKTLWVRLFEKYYQDNAEKDIAISDVRFKDEADTINELNGLIIKIVRVTPGNVSDGNVGDSKVGDRVVPQHLVHKSEMQSNFEPHVVIVNDGTLEDLYKKVDDAMSKGSPL